MSFAWKSWDSPILTESNQSQNKNLKLPDAPAQSWRGDNTVLHASNCLVNSNNYKISISLYQLTNSI